jgi:membrane-bound lytic murein transglycosylase E
LLKIRHLILSALLLTGCASEPPHHAVKQRNTPLTQAPPSSVNGTWAMFTEDAASHYGVDEKLISAIISVESGGNPREVYRTLGRRGQPSNAELRDPAKNIDIGTAYIRILQNSALSGIRDPLTLRYATIVSYANGAGALLRTFSSDRDRAIAMINAMSPDEFYQHVQNKHPAAQAPRYLWKVTTAYRTI